MNQKEYPTFIIVGLPCQFLMWVAMGITIGGIAHASSFAGQAISGDLSGVAAAMSQALLASEIGLPLGMIGYVLLYLGLINKRARAPWIYWSGKTVSFARLVIVPWATIAGIHGLTHFRRHRSEYFAEDSPPAHVA